ncbi:crotonase/enoyl-CoA hydratase family protein [Nocardioides dongxiaopingii]|uniref:crotonase/enoyl-CoA hydratase family protein n=1 Tax=Nocardioides sp. S-1144 TaxID=2582905 RepID=UPI001C9E30F6|nr:crotonase/enoyl-CoA hydratase family protein [Nocardioides sp. S-1144]
MSRPGRAARAVRSARALGDVARLVAREPGLVKDVVGGALPEPLRRLAGLGGPQDDAPGADLAAGPDPVPPELEGHLRSIAADTVLDASPAATRELVGDLGLQEAWLTLHAGWRGSAPGPAVEGTRHGQQLKIMGIPAEVTWTVLRADDDVLVLDGTGPMGLRLGLAATITPVGRRTRVALHAGLSGDPVKGPLGASVSRSIAEALRLSLDNLRAHAAAAGPTTASSGFTTGRAVLHRASGLRLDPRTPVIVGVGQVVQRDPSAPWREPADLAAAAVQRAAEDSGTPRAADLLASADSVYAVASASWQYRDLAAVVAARVGAEPSVTLQTARFGGDGGQLVINEAARAIGAGEAGVVLVLGAEAGASLARAQREGTTPAWTEQDAATRPTRSLGSEREANTELEGRVGLGAPVYNYALMESALRARDGSTKQAHQEKITRLWASLSEVAATNEHAWLPTSFTAEELATTGPDNRPVTSPYPKLLCANLQVDLASGTILTSVAAAERAGVPQEQWVFPHAGAAAHDEWFVSERATLAGSPAVRAVGAALAAHTGRAIADVEVVDLYSCFPAAVQIAAHELGLPVGDPARPLSVAGGLTFAGGPGNNYGGHAVAAVVARLRREPEAFALTTSLGWYATKHAAALLSATPPTVPFADLRPTVPIEPRRPAVGEWEGPAVVEACTVSHDRAGAPEWAILSAITADGSRGLVRVTDVDLVRRLESEDPLGWTVALAGEDLVVLAEGRAELPSPPPLPVLVEDHGPVRVITLDRPEHRNAIDLATAELLERVVDAFEADDSVRVAILTGGTSVFSAGMDLRAAATGQFPITERRGPLGMTGLPLTKPLIAAVEGPALAGGCELALAADLIVAATDATFGLPEPRRGLAAAAGGVLRLTERLPRNVAMQMALTGEPVPARRLHDLGLVNVLAEPGAVLQAALDLAGSIAANAPLSVEVSREIVCAAPGWGVEEAFARQADLAGRALGSADAVEGVRAFAEGRAPVWTGR